MREPNAAIAAKYGISLRTVSRRRADMGFAVKKQPEKYDWSKAEFGRKSDVEIAGEMGVSITAVARARRRRGIGRAAHSAYVRDIDWDALDYSLSDAANAMAIGCDPRLVTRERKARGIERKVTRKAASAESLAVSHETVRAQYAEMLARFEKRKATRAAAWARKNGTAPKMQAVETPAVVEEQPNVVQDGGGT
jgi:GNAT superfamily N-acetyltransferase